MKAKAKRDIKLILFVFFMSTVFSRVYAQEYIIGVDDVLEIKFWQDPQLDFTTKVGKDSMIALPFGEPIKASGLTTKELATDIVERVFLFNRRITQAAVNVKEFDSRKIYIMGSVNNPGKYTFEQIPNLWEIISEAGGPTNDANLSDVMIIRNKNNEDETIINVDLANYLKENKLGLVPKIKPHDNIYIPAVVGNVPNFGMAGAQKGQNVLFIYGQVGNPGVYSFNKELSILEALVTAGGPSTNANLKQVKVIRKTGAYSSVIMVNVDRYTKESVPSFFIVKGGDAIFVPRKKSFRESIAWNFIMIGSTAAITAIVYNLVATR